MGDDMLIPLGVAGLAIFGLAAWSAWVGTKAEDMVRADGEFLDLDGGCLHYVDTGPRDAPTIVMIHGILAQLRNFSYAMLDDLAKDHRVVLIDRPGWGHSTTIGRRPGIARQAAMIHEALDRLEVSDPLLVGHSMGGAVSLAYALAYPSEIRGLALIAPFTQPTDQVPPMFKSLAVPPPLRPAIAWTLAVPIGMATGPAKARDVFAPDAVPADFATRAGGALSIRPRSFQQGAFELGIARDEAIAMAARYGEIAVPVAILYGKGDAVLDPELHGRKTAEAIPGAKLTLIEGGHMLPITHAETTLAWLREADAAISPRPAESSIPG